MFLKTLSHFNVLVTFMFPLCFQYPQSNIRVIMELVLGYVQSKGGPKQLMSRYIGQDPDDSGFVSEKSFRFVEILLQIFVTIQWR